jgi:hypothetical protein
MDDYQHWTLTSCATTVLVGFAAMRLRELVRESPPQRRALG